jgi:general secretion pathway protein G
MRPQSENGSDCKEAKRATNSRALIRLRLLKLVAATLMIGCGIAWTALGDGYTLVHYVSPVERLRSLLFALEAFRLDHGRYPTREEGLGILVEGPTKSNGQERWGGPYIDNLYLKDLWGHPYEYRSPGRNGRPFEIFSPGKDGLYGTNDDIHSWELDKLDKIYWKHSGRVSLAGPIGTVFTLGFWFGAGSLTVLWILAPRLKIKYGMMEK